MNVERSIYLLVFNALDLSLSRIGYWLRKLKIVHKRCPPVFLVGTHADDPTCTDEVKQQNAQVLQKEVEKINAIPGFSSQDDFIQGLFYVSCKTGKGTKKNSLLKRTDHCPMGNGPFFSTDCSSLQ